MSEHAPHTPTPLEQEAERLAAQAFMGTSPNPEQDMQTALDTRRMLNERPAGPEDVPGVDVHYNETMRPDQRAIDQKEKAANLVNQWALADLKNDRTRAYEIREELERRSLKGLVTDRKTNKTGLGPYADEFHGAANRMNALFDRKERVKGSMIIERLSPAPRTPEAQPKPDNAETQEIPVVKEEGGKLAPEIDLRDLDKDGLRVTELIALRNANRNWLPRREQSELDRLRQKLNGGYATIAERQARDPKELPAAATRAGITLPKLLERLAKFEQKQREDKEKGLPTYNDKLALTGDKLYAMFAADSPDVDKYVGKGGLTPQMQKLLVELNKNKGTAATWFEKVNGKWELTPQTSSAHRARKVEKMVKAINAEHRVPLRWVDEFDKDNKLIRTVPDLESDETRGVGNALLEQFRGNRQVNANTRKRRARNWLGKHALPLSVESEVSKNEQLMSHTRHIGRIGTRGAGVNPTLGQVR